MIVIVTPLELVAGVDVDAAASQDAKEIVEVEENKTIRKYFPPVV